MGSEISYVAPFDTKVYNTLYLFVFLVFLSKVFSYFECYCSCYNEKRNKQVNSKDIKATEKQNKISKKVNYMFYVGDKNNYVQM